MRVNRSKEPLVATERVVLVAVEPLLHDGLALPPGAEFEALEVDAGVLLAAGAALPAPV